MISSARDSKLARQRGRLASSFFAIMQTLKLARSQGRLVLLLQQLPGGEVTPREALREVQIRGLLLGSPSGPPLYPPCFIRRSMSRKAIRRFWGNKRRASRNALYPALKVFRGLDSCMEPFGAIRGSRAEVKTMLQEIDSFLMTAFRPCQNPEACVGIRETGVIFGCLWKYVSASIRFPSW